MNRKSHFFSDTELPATEYFGYKRLEKQYDDKSLWGKKKRSLEPVRHYELGVGLAQEVPKSL